MNNRAVRFIWFCIMILVGACGGLYYAWRVNPPEYVDASFHDLRQDYKTDYVLMVAETYDEDHVLYQAMLSLDKLMEESAEEAVETAIRNAEGFGYAQVDLEKLYRLREAITGERSTATPQYDPTMEFSIQMTSTAVAFEEMPLETGMPRADSDPFGTSPTATPTPVPVQNDGTAVPVQMMENPPAQSSGEWQPTAAQFNENENFDTFFEDDNSFGSGIPDDYFEAQ